VEHTTLGRAGELNQPLVAHRAQTAKAPFAFVDLACLAAQWAGYAIASPWRFER
jgi:hypothetical protein